MSPTSPIICPTFIVHPNYYHSTACMIIVITLTTYTMFHMQPTYMYVMYNSTNDQNNSNYTQVIEHVILCQLVYTIALIKYHFPDCHLHVYFNHTAYLLSRCAIFMFIIVTGLSSLLVLLHSLQKQTLSGIKSTCQSLLHSYHFFNLCCCK